MKMNPPKKSSTLKSDFQKRLEKGSHHRRLEILDSFKNKLCLSIALVNMKFYIEDTTTIWFSLYLIFYY